MSAPHMSEAPQWEREPARTHTRQGEDLEKWRQRWHNMTHAEVKSAAKMNKAGVQDFLGVDFAEREQFRLHAA